MKVCICGDIYPDETIKTRLVQADSLGLVGEGIYRRLQAADYCIANLETPLTKRGKGISKNGPVLYADPETAKGIAALGIDFVSLANNHIFDCGEVGLIDTYKALDRNGIKYAGTGDKLKTVRKTHYFEKNGVKIGIYVCAENEFSIATEETPGANPFDLYQNCCDIEEMKKQCNRVLVLLHGGKEYYRYPSPHLQSTCHALVDSGADLVVCQHSHCVGAKEEYKDATIVYGQGNFIFLGPDDEYWNNGLLIEWCIDAETSRVEFVPFECSPNGIHEADGSKREALLNSFYERSALCHDSSFLQRKYDAFSDQFFMNYVNAIFGYSKWERRLDKYLLNGRIYRKKLNRSRALALLNFVECEAHRELLAHGLKRYVDKEES